MSPAVRMVGAPICLVLVVLANSKPGAAPKFSDWAAPTNLGQAVNSPFNEMGPAISKDGLSLFFASDRPRPDGTSGGQDIWVTQRASVSAPWGAPAHLGDVVNTTFAENVPALSRDEHWMFFSSDRPGGAGSVDIWAAWRANRHDDFGWDSLVHLGSNVNSAAFDAGPAYLENEDAGVPLLFFTRNRPGTADFDVRVSEQAPDGSFGPSTLVSELNSPFNEGRPTVRFDGLELFLHSNQLGGPFDLWTSTRETVFGTWSTPVALGATVNSASADQHPYVAADRQTLFFASNRPDGFGAFDLYVTTRTKNEP